MADNNILEELSKMSSKNIDIKTTHKFNKWILILIIILLILDIASYFMMRFDFFTSKQLLLYKPILKKFIESTFIILMLFFVYIMSSIYLFSKIEDPTPRYYAFKIAKIFTWFIVIMVFISSFSSNWSNLFTSLGLFSIIAGIALQAPVSNFFAWIFLLISPVYRVGDRVKIGNATGDIIDVGYFYTTLWEFHGEYLSNDLPSGKIINIPNSVIFNTDIYNYSWPLFPYIWTEITFYVSYYADFEFIETTVKKITSEVIGEEMKKNVAKYKKILESTPVDNLEVQDEPRVFFEPDRTTWVKVIVRFLGLPKEITETKKILSKKIIKELLLSPEKTQFPLGQNR